MKASRTRLTVLVVALAVGAPAAVSASGPASDPSGVAAYWSAERRAQAQPRDLVFDERGLAYLRLKGGALEPYGHDVPARLHASRSRAGVPAPAAKPGGSDTTPPSISNVDPAAGATIGAAHTFSATVADAQSGVKSVSFVLTYPDGRTQSFSATRGANDVWSIDFSGFSDGSWSWRVVAKDYGAKGGNTATSPLVGFTVSGEGGGGGGDTTVTNSQWSAGGTVQTAAGRIYFELPSNPSQTRWSGYVCSGSVGTDSSGQVSVILTAAHCVYDDANKAFARNVLFVPNQAGTTGSGTDLNCNNDPLGCWVPSHGVVDQDWASRSWPDNIPWDYGFYVVPVTGAHTGASVSSQSLEVAAGSLGISFTQPQTGTYTHAFGYSYSDDPKLMYCAQDLSTEGASNWWLSQCGLSGGASGGPWIQPFATGSGSGPVISVNSWGYRGSPGMAGPKLSGSSASCLFTAAQSGAAPTNRGLIPSSC